MLTIYVVSDATGHTGERVIRSALTQFTGAEVQVLRRPNVQTPEHVRAVLKEAAARDSIVVHTLVSDDLRDVMLEEARLHGVDSWDMLGPILERLARHLKIEPEETPGLFARSREIEAVDFAFRHDDGQNAQELDRAEIVLVGISRSMKTPTMLYLAYHGWFAANVPIVPEVPLPPDVLRLPPRRVFCLTMSPVRLQELRRTRALQSNIPLEPYTSLDQIRRELFQADELVRRQGWWTIDTTGRSVEEVGREIIVLRSKDPRGEDR